MILSVLLFGLVQDFTLLASGDSTARHGPPHCQRITDADGLTGLWKKLHLLENDAKVPSVDFERSMVLLVSRPRAEASKVKVDSITTSDKAIELRFSHSGPDETRPKGFPVAYAIVVLPRSTAAVKFIGTWDAAAWKQSGQAEAPQDQLVRELAASDAFTELISGSDALHENGPEPYERLTDADAFKKCWLALRPAERAEIPVIDFEKWMVILVYVQVRDASYARVESVQSVEKELVVTYARGGESKKMPYGIVWHTLIRVRRSTESVKFMEVWDGSDPTAKAKLVKELPALK